MNFSKIHFFVNCSYSCKSSILMPTFEKFGEIRRSSSPKSAIFVDRIHLRRRNTPLKLKNVKRGKKGIVQNTSMILHKILEFFSTILHIFPEKIKTEHIQFGDSKKRKLVFLFCFFKFAIIFTKKKRAYSRKIITKK